MRTPIGEAPAHFVVIVPGYMGSKLRDRDTGKVVWVDFASLPKNPAQWDDWLNDLLRALAYPNDALEPAGIMDQLIFIPPWAKQEHYIRLLEALGKMGYRADPGRYAERELEVYGFAYDWRQDNRTSARQLAEAIERWRSYHPGCQPWIIAHSNGGVVARWYIEKEGGKALVGRLFLMGSPWDGTPKAMQMLFGGLDMLFRRRFNVFDIPRRSRDLIRTFPSIYQLVPCHNPFLQDVHNQPVDPFSNTRWLANERQRQLLLDAREFNSQLGTDLSVETLCFFGRKRPTATGGQVQFAAGGKWKSIDWLATAAGDGTIPERSAAHPNADQKLPFAVGHGDIYVSPAVLEFLEWELGDKYGQPKAAIMATPELYISFEADRDSYACGEEIVVSARVLGPTDASGQRAPLSDASISVSLIWREAMPGSSSAGKRPMARQAHLAPGPEPGCYSGQLRAPAAEGYYDLRGVVHAGDAEPLVLNEVLAVEAGPPS